MGMDTGHLSLLLCAVLMVVALVGIIAIYLMIKNKEIENENVDKIVDLGKWFIVSVAIVLSTSIVNDGFRERDQDIKEMEVFDKYVTTILEADGLEKRRALCEYFAAVSPNGQVRESWRAYKDVIDKQIVVNNELVAKVKEIEKREAEQAASAADLKKKDALLAQIESNNESLAPPLGSSNRGVTPRVYIHIAGDGQRASMQLLQKQLIMEGFLVPGIENVKGVADIPKTSNVRFFNDSDEGIANIVAGRLREAGGVDVNVYHVRKLSARPGHLEIWLSEK